MKATNYKKQILLNEKSIKNTLFKIQFFSGEKTYHNIGLPFMFPHSFPVL